MSKKLTIAAFLSLFITAQAFALSLDEAKSKGLVGETPSGYLEVVQSNAEASSLAHEVNSKRREHYQEIAKKNGTPLKAVEELAGKKAIEKTVRGNYVKVNGAWVKK